MNKAQCYAPQQPVFHPAPSFREAPRAAGGPLARTIRTLLIWQDRVRQRALLASLDDRLLRDIGISRANAERESSIPFWRIS